ncbi:NAD(P)-dependent dehydrogenase (short-subunit alcohol dehydrogenase family) [Nakamurella sp. UYEF19]|uniref:SDR family NAD(P)-dependent oxidoreductase n=1 Tax=Nakamurella sp. UYEF19 TaxID=1756392 RepID=UPI0033931B32
MPKALITGASLGLGRALALALAFDGWHVIVDARGPDALERLLDDAGPARRSRITTIAGDVTDPAHRADLVAAVGRSTALDLLVNNASTLGATPLAPLSATASGALDAVLQTNTISPLLLATALLPQLSASAGTVINVSSDASVEHYENWGLYGASKAALDHLTLTLAVENPALRWYAVDPGDMHTAMAQEAFAGEDISDRQVPEKVAVPAILDLLTSRPPSGRYTVGELRPRADTAPMATAPIATLPSATPPTTTAWIGATS